MEVVFRFAEVVSPCTPCHTGTAIETRLGAGITGLRQCWNVEGAFFTGGILTFSLGDSETKEVRCVLDGALGESAELHVEPAVGSSRCLGELQPAELPESPAPHAASAKGGGGNAGARVNNAHAYRDAAEPPPKLTPFEKLQKVCTPTAAHTSDSNMNVHRTCSTSACASPSHHT